MELRTLFDTLLSYNKIFRLAVRLLWPFENNPVGENKNLLLLAWLFPPTVSGGVYRPLSIARTAIANGWEVTVVAGPIPEQITEAGSYLLSRLPANVKVINIKPNTLKPTFRFFPRCDGGLLNALETIDICCAPEFHKPSIILASGPPFHNFIAGAYISRYHKRPLVLDYRDEWTDCPFDFIQKGNIDKFAEHLCLRRASSILVTTESFKEQSQKTFPDIDQNKFAIIPNGFEEDELPLSIRKRPNTSNGLFRISFMGTLSGHSNPLPFLNTVASLLSIREDFRSYLRISFVGKRRDDLELDIRNHEIAQIIELTNQVNKPEAIRLMCESNALLSLNPPEIHRYIPGKLFDYVASGTPIIVFGQGGEISRIVESLGVGICVQENDPLALAFAIDKIRHTSSLSDVDARSAWLAKHERNNIANQLLNYLNGLIPSPSHQ